MDAQTRMHRYNTKGGCHLENIKADGAADVGGVFSMTGAAVSAAAPGMGAAAAGASARLLGGSRASSDSAEDCTHLIIQIAEERIYITSQTAQWVREEWVSVGACVRSGHADA